MSPEGNFIIKSEHGHFALRIISVCGFPESTCYWGGYETDSWVEILTFNYTAKGGITISTYDIYKFYIQLIDCFKSLTGHAELISCEGNLNLDLAFDNLGHVVISGKLHIEDSNKNELSFELFGDQSYLPETINSLKKIIDTYGDQFGKKISN
jgi:hypothetical protein